jgi:hypothetical protein
VQQVRRAAAELVKRRVWLEDGAEKMIHEAEQSDVLRWLSGSPLDLDITIRPLGHLVCVAPSLDVSTESSLSPVCCFRTSARSNWLAICSSFSDSSLWPRRP